MWWFTFHPSALKVLLLRPSFDLSDVGLENAFLLLCSRPLALLSDSCPLPLAAATPDALGVGDLMVCWCLEAGFTGRLVDTLGFVIVSSSCIIRYVGFLLVLASIPPPYDTSMLEDAYMIIISNG